MDIQATQAIALSDYDEDDGTDEDIAADKKPVATLRVLLHRGYQQREFHVYEGCNLIGRDPSCNIHIDLKALSKKHAFIEVKSGHHFIVDKGSKNKTRRNKMFLIPEARYEIQPGDKLTFADVDCIYTIINRKNADSSTSELVVPESGSETGSESVLSQRKDITEVQSKPKEEEEFDDKSEPSSDLLQPTQHFPANDTSGDKKAVAGKNKATTSLFYATDSDESDTEAPVKPFCLNQPLVAETPAVSRLRKVNDDTCIPDSQALDKTGGDEGITETVVYEEESESDTEERHKMALQPTQAFGTVVEESDDNEDIAESTGFNAETHDTSTPITCKGKKGAHKIKQDKHQITGTVAYDMDVESTQTAAEIKAAKKKRQMSGPGSGDAETPQYDMDVGATQTGDQGNASSETSINPDEAPTQTFGNDVESGGTVSPNTKKINLGAGETMAYEYEEDSSDDEPLIPLVKTAVKFKNVQSDDEDQSTQSFAADETAPLDDGSTTAVVVINKSESKVQDNDDTQGFDETVDVSAAVHDDDDDDDDDAPTQCLGGADNMATQVIEVPGKSNVGKGGGGKDKTDLDDMETQAVDNMETQVIELSSKSGASKSRGKNIRSCSPISDIENMETQVVGDMETQVIEGTTKSGDGKVRGRKKQSVSPAADLDDMETQVVENMETQVIDKHTKTGIVKGHGEKGTVDIHDMETQAVDNMETQVIEVSVPHGTRKGLGKKGRSPSPVADIHNMETLAADNMETQVIEVSAKSGAGKGRRRKGRTPSPVEDIHNMETLAADNMETQVIEVSAKSGAGKGRRRKGRTPSPVEDIHNMEMLAADNMETQVIEVSAKSGAGKGSRRKGRTPSPVEDIHNIETLAADNMETQVIDVSAVSKSRKRKSKSPSPVADIENMETVAVDNMETQVIEVTTKSSVKKGRGKVAKKSKVEENIDNEGKNNGNDNQTLVVSGLNEETQSFNVKDTSRTTIGDNIEATQIFTDKSLKSANTTDELTVFKSPINPKQRNSDFGTKQVFEEGATQIFSDDIDTQSPTLVVSRASKSNKKQSTRKVFSPERMQDFDPDQCSTQIFNEKSRPQTFDAFEDQPTQILPTAADMSTQKMNDSTDIDEDGFTKPMIPFSKQPAPPASSKLSGVSAEATSAVAEEEPNTDNLCTQAYELDTDNEDDTEGETENKKITKEESKNKHFSSECDLMAPTLPALTDNIETQAYDMDENNENDVDSPVFTSKKTRGGRVNTKSKKKEILPEDTDMVATQAYSLDHEISDSEDESVTTKNSKTVVNSDNMETQAYMAEEDEEEISKYGLEMELSTVEASTSKVEETIKQKTTKKTQPKKNEKKLRGQPITEQVDSSQPELDNQPVPVVPQIISEEPVTKGRARKRKKNSIQQEEDVSESKKNRPTEDKKESPIISKTQTTRSKLGRGAKTESLKVEESYIEIEEEKSQSIKKGKTLNKGKATKGRRRNNSKNVDDTKELEASEEVVKLRGNENKEETPESSSVVPSEDVPQVSTVGKGKGRKSKGNSDTSVEVDTQEKIVVGLRGKKGLKKNGQNSKAANSEDTEITEQTDINKRRSRSSVIAESNKKVDNESKIEPSNNLIQNDTSILSNPQSSKSMRRLSVTSDTSDHCDSQEKKRRASRRSISPSPPSMENSVKTGNKSKGKGKKSQVALTEQYSAESLEVPDNLSESLNVNSKQKGRTKSSRSVSPKQELKVNDPFTDKTVSHGIKAKVGKMNQSSQETEDINVDTDTIDEISQSHSVDKNTPKSSKKLGILSKPGEQSPKKGNHSVTFIEENESSDESQSVQTTSKKVKAPVSSSKSKNTKESAGKGKAPRKGRMQNIKQTLEVNDENNESKKESKELKGKAAKGSKKQLENNEQVDDEVSNSSSKNKNANESSLTGKGKAPRKGRMQNIKQSLELNEKMETEEVSKEPKGKAAKGNKKQIENKEQVNDEVSNSSSTGTTTKESPLTGKGKAPRKGRMQNIKHTVEVNDEENESKEPKRKAAVSAKGSKKQLENNEQVVDEVSKINKGKTMSTKSGKMKSSNSNEVNETENQADEVNTKPSKGKSLAKKGGKKTSKANEDVEIEEAAVVDSLTDNQIEEGKYTGKNLIKKGGKKSAKTNEDENIVEAVTAESKEKDNKHQDDEEITKSSKGKAMAKKGGKKSSKTNQDSEESIEEVVITKKGKRGQKVPTIVTTAPENNEPNSTPDLNSKTNEPSTNQKQRGKAKKRGKASLEQGDNNVDSQESVPPDAKKRKQEASPQTPQRSKSALSKGSKASTPGTPSLRRRTLDRKPKVMFTGVVDEDGQNVVESLGGELVTSIQHCTHLVTDKVRRTVKFLCGVARGLLIVKTDWLEQCRISRMFIDASPFLIEDVESEKAHSFSLRKSIDFASEHGGMLAGYKIHVTNKVKPEPEQMKDIIVSAGGQYLASMPKKADNSSKTVIVSCSADLNSCKNAVKLGIPVVGAEFILTGVLHQKVEVERYKLVGEAALASTSTSSSSAKRKKR